MVNSNSNTPAHGKSFNPEEHLESKEQELKQKLISNSTGCYDNKLNSIGSSLGGITLGVALGAGAILLGTYLYHKKLQADAKLTTNAERNLDAENEIIPTRRSQVRLVM